VVSAKNSTATGGGEVEEGEGKKQNVLQKVVRVLIARVRFLLAVFGMPLGAKKEKEDEKKKSKRSAIVLLLIAAFSIPMGLKMLSSTIIKPVATSLEVPYSSFLELATAKGKGVEQLDDVKFSLRRIDFRVGDDQFFTRPVLATGLGANLMESLMQKGVVFSAQKVSTLATTFTAMMPLLIAIIWALLVSQMLTGNNNSDVGKMAVPTGGFDQVAGIDEAKVELVEIVDLLKNPNKYAKSGARMPKGVLMIGEPGTGKTLLARAMAGEAGVPFFDCSGSEFVEMFVGRGASRLRSLFKKARAAAPCVIFIDELDALGRKRDGIFGGAASELEQTLNQLLVSMDGLDSAKGIIVLGATNRPEVLDSALCRPGRFDRIVRIEKPDRDGREAILRVHTKWMTLAPEVSLEEIAAVTPGFTGAELEGVCNEAAIRSVRRGDPKGVISYEDFQSALKNFAKSRSWLTRNPIKDLGAGLQNTFFGGDSAAVVR